MLETVEQNTIERLRGHLKKLRARHCLTQEEFAHAADLDYKFYQSIEAGRRTELRISTLERMARAYGLEPYQLLAPKVPQTKNNRP